MAAPRNAPVSFAARAHAYASPEHVPAAWQPDRKGEIDGLQPSGARLGNQGPDQGYVLLLAAKLRPQVQVQKGEHVDDALRGCINIALKRASLFSRAPVVHDLTIALTIWGWLDASPPADLVECRRALFEGVAHVTAHYSEGRVIADMVPETTLRMTPSQVRAAMPASWKLLTGVPAK